VLGSVGLDAVGTSRAVRRWSRAGLLRATHSSAARLTQDPTQICLTFTGFHEGAWGSVPRQPAQR